MTNSSARVDIKGRPVPPVDLLVCDNMAFACVDVALQVGNPQGGRGAPRDSKPGSLIIFIITIQLIYDWYRHVWQPICFILTIQLIYDRFKSVPV